MSCINVSALNNANIKQLCNRKFTFYTTVIIEEIANSKYQTVHNTGVTFNVYTYLRK